MSSGLSWAAPGCSCTLWDDILLFVRASRSLQVRFIKVLFLAPESSSKTRLVSIQVLEPFWDPFWLILAPLLEPFLCHFGALTMILALLCRDTVFGRFLVTVDTVKPSKNLCFSMVFDDFRDVDRCLIGTAKIA